MTAVRWVSTVGVLHALSLVCVLKTVGWPVGKNAKVAGKVEGRFAIKPKMGAWGS